MSRRIPGPPFFRRPKPFAGGEVWIVQHDESPDNTVLSVFAIDDDRRRRSPYVVGQNVVSAVGRIADGATP